VTEASAGDDVATTASILLAVKLDVMDLACEVLTPTIVTTNKLEEVVNTLRADISITVMLI